MATHLGTLVQPVKTSSRLAFIDNIRWAMIVLVIFHHSAVTYGHVGSWFYNEQPEPGLAIKLIIATFLSFNQAYFMGFLFLIAGYFAAPSFDRKGFGPFMRDRLKRLAVPSLFFMLLVYPVIVYYILRDFYEPSRPALLQAYVPFLTSGRVLSASGPMWFAVALLIFCLCYGLIRLSPVAQAQVTQAASYPNLPQTRHIIAFMLFIAAATFLVRIFQPVGTSVLNMQLCNFAQYITLFTVGVLAYRKDWLQRIQFRFAMTWFVLALTVGLVLWIAVLGSGGTFGGHVPTPIFGGLHWQSALNCLWESFVCLGMSLGVLVIFRDRIRVPERFASFMSRNAFSAYLFHTPLLIVVTLLMHSIVMPVLIKFLVAGAIATVVTFLSSEYVFRRIPLLEQIL